METSVLPGAQERQRILELGLAVWAFSALAGAVEGGILDELATPQTPAQLSTRTGASAALIEAVLDVLAALGLVQVAGEAFVCSPGMSAYTGGAPQEFLRADLRATPLMAAELASRFRAGGAAAHGWRYADPDLLQAWGVRSVESVPIWVERLFPALDGLCEALKAPTASFLDVGTGVGRLAIAMCEQFPALRVVGLDPYDPALELARQNVAEAGLADRIELRPGLVQQLADENCYDLAWVPVMFMPADVAARGLHRVRAALRPGGWAVLGSMAGEGDGLQPAVLRLVSLLFGSGRLFADDAAAMLRAATYDCIQILPAAPGVPIRMIVGRRPVS
ncbi:MAG TPA: class I SAM-dependent methyltransferase [Pseudonocardiaceae bacterium]|nr:class I SAM-dependent methyltransferase [Pseudonocardiaceae bacterium]